MKADSIPLPRLIVGLGNPGSEYEHTRHNTGVDFLMALADGHDIAMRPESRFFGICGRGSIADHEVRLLFPTTFMNDSGKAVGAVCTFYKIRPEEILVIHDDLDIKPGQMKLRFGGGLAGHNGLKSISQYLGNTQSFMRLRIGIGMPPSHDVVSWVLGRPFGSDKEATEAACDCALGAIDTLYRRGLDRATMAVNGFKYQAD
jgi:PTH1 family peptidyl-tRNA hydrolase